MSKMGKSIYVKSYIGRCVPKSHVELIPSDYNSESSTFASMPTPSADVKGRNTVIIASLLNLAARIEMWVRAYQQWCGTAVHLG